MKKKLSIQIFLMVCAVFMLGMAFKQNVQNNDDPKVAKLKLSPGFMAEHLYSPSENNQGSWVSMCFDDKGRMLASDQYGGIYRLNIPALGIANTQPKVEKLKIGPDTLQMGAAQGLLFAFNSLYVMVNNRPDKSVNTSSGLYRLQDLDGDDQFETVTLLKALKGSGEHGPHSIKLSPDGTSLYVIAGNYTDMPTMDKYRLPKTWAYDNLFPEIKDPRGHANDRKEPGGWVAKIDPEGKHWELMAAGFRNAFDMAFNEEGDLFVYDADMEWDFGTPWYRPTRICHAVSGAEFGWRTGNGKWSPSFPDNLPPVINIGQGSPTNLLHLGNANFPAHYKKALLAFDWSFGIIHVLFLQPKGATYTATRQEFLSGVPLPLTDGAIGPDGALYFLTGGRRLASDLYRVSFNGVEPLNVSNNIDNTPTYNKLRKSLETYHETNKPGGLEQAWLYLAHADRFVRYAARLILEHNDTHLWAQKALTEKSSAKKITALLALVRANSNFSADELVAGLGDVDYGKLNAAQKLEILRVYELIISRKGKPSSKVAEILANKLNAYYPATESDENKALSKILISLEHPEAVNKTMSLLQKPYNASEGIATATSSADLILRNPQYGLDIAQMLESVPPLDQTYFAIVLSQATIGWTKKLYKTYFKWYKKAFTYKGGLSYIGFLEKARKTALEKTPEKKRSYYDKISGGGMLTANGNDIAKTVYPKGPGKNWQLKDITTLVETPLTKRNFENGRNMFQATTCATCHAMNGKGGNIGPDLSRIGTRFTTADILEAIINPDKSISDQYAAAELSIRTGESIVGRIAKETATSYWVSQNPYTPDVLLEVKKEDVVKNVPSQVSVMLPGLINSLNEEELKDLLAYLVAGGNANNKVFE